MENEEAWIGFAAPSDVEKAAVSAPQLLGIDAPLNMEKEAASAPNLLGFAAPLEQQAIDETEIQASSLGFGEAPSSINGGRRFEPFNLEEFLRLANAVIDKGDEKTIVALRDLKDRWKERFRSIPSLRSFVETGNRKLISSDSEKQSSAIGISAGNATVLPVTGERRVPQLADVAIVGDGDDELAVAVADDVEGDVTDDARMTTDDITADISFPTRLFVGNIPLHACSDTIINDKIAHAFHNSTGKTLSYVAPTMQNGEVIVRPTLDIIRNGSKRWRATAVGYFLGKRLYFYPLKEFAMS
ncbi:UNVERIFIED_CONTAM: hypothetical protein Sindi_0099300, partial [Sesamum indicum]